MLAVVLLHYICCISVRLLSILMGKRWVLFQTIFYHIHLCLKIYMNKSHSGSGKGQSPLNCCQPLSARLINVCSIGKPNKLLFILILQTIYLHKPNSALLFTANHITRLPIATLSILNFHLTKTTVAFCSIVKPGIFLLKLTLKLNIFPSYRIHDPHTMMTRVMFTIVGLT